MKKNLLVLFCSVLSVSSPLCNSASATNLTSVTVEAVTSVGAWTNAPGGIWTTNLADPFAQVGVAQNGVFLNHPGGNLDLGEISIPLQAGLNTFTLYENSFRGGFDFYGIDLFFNGIATPPSIVAFNAAGASGGDFTITPAGTTVAGSANGGLTPDVAPGSVIFSDPDGSLVKLVSFSAAFSQSNPDLISYGNIGADGIKDTVAVLTLDFTPAAVPEPATMLLFGTGLAGLFAARRKKKSTPNQTI